MRIRPAAAALLLVALLPAAPASADTGPAPGRLTVGLQPATNDVPDPRAHYTYALAPGAVRQDAVAVFNYGTTAVDVRLAARDGLTTTAGGLDVAPSDARAHDVGAWVALGRATLHLAPRSRVVVPFQVGVPYDATPGDHTGAVVLSLTTTSAAADRKVEVENRVGLRIYLRVAGPVTPRLAVADLHARYRGGLRPSWRGPVDVSFTLRNTGNVRLGARERVVLTDLTGRVVGRATLAAPLVLLPGSTVPVHTTIDGVAALARLKATVTAEPQRLEGDTGPPLPPVTATASFVALPWLPLLMVLGLGLAYAAWRRYRKARPPREGRHRRPRPEARHAKEPAVLAGVALLLMLLAAPASAASTGPWAATVSPGSGTDETPIALTTSGGCPAPASNIVARVYGAGFPAEGVNVVGNTAAGVRADRAFEVPLAVTLRDVARDQEQVVTLRGRYRLDVVCRTARDPQPVGVYSAAVVFTSPTAWHADKAVTTARGPVSTASPSPGSGDAPLGAPGAPRAPAGAAAPGGVSVPPGANGTAAATTKTSRSGLSPLLLVVLVVPALCAAFAAGRRRGARPTGREPRL